MRILVIDAVLEHGLLLAQRLDRDGHDVVYCGIWASDSTSPYVDSVGRGFPFVSDPQAWTEYIDWADVATITGCEHRGFISDFLRMAGTPVAGPGKIAARLELDRNFGRDAFRAMGLDPPASRTFSSATDVVAFLETHPGHHVLKVDPTARDALETVVGTDPEGRDLLEEVRRLKTQVRFAEGQMRFHVEDRLFGDEVGVTGWFNGEHLIGELLVGYEGNAGFSYDGRIPASALVPVPQLERLLRSCRYHGPFDIYGVLTSRGEYRPLEWTIRWGNAIVELFCHATPDLGELIKAAATRGDAPVVHDDVRGHVTAIVPARAPDESPDIRDVVVPPGETLPVVRARASFWAEYPTGAGSGWMTLPVGAANRVASYVGTGRDLKDALAEVRALTKEVWVTGTTIPVDDTEDELSSRMQRVLERVAGP